MRRTSHLQFIFLLLVALAMTYPSPQLHALPSPISTEIPKIIVKKPVPAHLSTTSGPKEIITQEQIMQSGATSLAATLQQLGNLQLQDTAGNSSQVLLNLRGFGSNATSNTLLLINGMPLTNPDMAPLDLNIIPIQSIELVEIIAGSESVLYGDQAVGGVINLITDQQIKKKFNIACNAGSYQQTGCHVAFYNHHDQLNYHFVFTTNKTDNYREHNHDQQNHLSGGISKTYAQSKLNISFHLQHENMEYPGALTAAQVRQNRRQASNGINYFRDVNGLIQLQHIQAINDDWQLNTQATLRNMQGHGVLFSAFNQARSTYFIKPLLTGHLYQANMTSGIEIEVDRYRLNSLFGLTEDQQRKYALFLLTHWPLRSLFNLTIGARAAEQTSRVQSFSATKHINRAFATTIGSTVELTQQVHAYLRRAESYRFPKADENAFAEPPNGLKTQRGVAYETGLEWDQPKYSAHIGLYQLNLKDEIMFDPLQTPQHPFGTNLNLAPTVRRGFMLSAKDHLNEKLMLNSQYHYVNARFQNGINAGNRIPLIAQHLIRTGIDYTFHEYWHVYGEAMYTGNQYAANDNANIAGKIGGYTVYNMTIGYAHQPFTASLRINNILNRHYYLYTVFEPTVNSEFFYPAPERNITLTVNYLLE